MLRIYPVILDWIASLLPLIRSIAVHDPHLADQLRRSSTSVGLNVAEGMGATGRSKTNCYRIALREMREAVAAVEIASRLAYVTTRESDHESHIIGTLVRLAKP